MFTGSNVAIVTPMLESGEIDYEALENLVTWHIEQGTKGLVLLGTTGEAATIEDDERAAIIRKVIRMVNAKIPIIVGTGTNSTRHTLTLTKQAMELGADAALLVTPYYNKPTQDGLFAHFQAVANAIPIPQILYNVPSRTGCDLLPNTVQRLAEFSNIVAIKEATPNLQRIDELLALKMEIDLLSGDDASAMEFILRGGKGVISVAANIVPKEFCDMCAAALRGDRHGAEALNNKLERLYKLLFIESNPIPVKWALKEMGKIQSGIRLPLTPLNEKYREDLRKALKLAELLSVV